VPHAVFGARTSGALAELRSGLGALPGRALGEPFFIQENEGGAGFVFECGASLVPMNLGDCGGLYAFASGALWQSH